MRDQALAKSVGEREQYTTVFSGMEIEPFESAARVRDAIRQRRGIAPGDFVIGTVARLAELKGHDDLLEALADDLKSNPEWKLLWVGDGWWRERLEKRVQELGLSNHVMLAGLVPPEDVPAWIAAMDVLVHPSYREGLPRTVPQALLSRVPVVVYDVDGAGEVCVPDETGLLVEPGDRKGLRGSVNWMALHPHERQVMAQRGWEKCRTQFDARIMVRDLEGIYEDVLESLKRRG
jgi:glycosyltransferase involved in cell wall biosynthesis